MSVGGFGNSGDGIVTDGLILSVDPYNKKSYVSGGTTCVDLTKNKYPGTLNNGVTYDDFSWIFDGTNQDVEINTGFGVTQPSLPITIDLWVKVNTPNLLQGVIALDKKVTSYYGVATYVSSSNNISLAIGDGAGFSPGNRRTITTPSNSITVGEWVHVTAVFIDAVTYDMTCYLDTVDVGGTTSGTGGAIAWSSDSSSRTLLANTWGNGSLYAEIDLSQVNVYNRELTIDEIKQNYNALKYRFR